MPKHNPDFVEPGYDQLEIPGYTEQIANVDAPLLNEEDITDPRLTDGVMSTPPNAVSSTNDNMQTMYVVNWRKLKNNANAVPVLGQIINQPSKTIPDQSMTIREILRRNAQGLSVNSLAKVPTYDGLELDDEMFPDLSKMDLADRQEILDFYEKKLKETTERLSQHAPRAKKEAQDSAQSSAKDENPPKDESPKKEGEKSA